MWNWCVCRGNYFFSLTLILLVERTNQRVLVNGKVMAALTRWRRRPIFLLSEMEKCLKERVECLFVSMVCSVDLHIQ